MEHAFAFIIDNNFMHSNVREMFLHLKQGCIKADAINKLPT